MDVWMYGYRVKQENNSTSGPARMGWQERVLITERSGAKAVATH